MAEAAKTAATEGPAQTATVKQEAENAQVLTNEQTVLKLAEIVGRISDEELVRILGQRAGEAVSRARTQVVEPRKAAASAAQASRQADHALGQLKREPLTADQQGEWLRVALLHMTGRWDAKPNPGLDADGVITQALSPTSNTAGGYLMPVEFVAAVEIKALEPAIIWPMIQKRPTLRRTVIKPEVTSYITTNTGVNAYVNSAVTTDEITPTEPVFDQLEWNLEDFDARMPLKLDLIEESPINVYDELVMLCADGFSINHETFPLTGRGHDTYKEPLGLLDDGAGISQVALSGATDSLGAILSFASQIPLRYRTRASIILGSQTLFSVVANLARHVHSAEYLLGKLPPLIESEHCPEGSMLGGDFSRYVVYFIRLLQVITSIHAERKTQEIVITETWTGKPTITNAFRIGTGAEYATPYD